MRCDLLALQRDYNKLKDEKVRFAQFSRNLKVLLKIFEKSMNLTAHFCFALMLPLVQKVFMNLFINWMTIILGALGRRQGTNQEAGVGEGHCTNTVR